MIQSLGFGLATMMPTNVFLASLCPEEILTVSSTCRVQNPLYEYLAPVTGEKGNAFMTNKINYSDGPMEEIRVFEDFLPSPEELAFREETVKVTIALSKSSVEFFKQEAQKNQLSYQKMIRRLLGEYTVGHRG
jgi:hypothetical protein